MATPCTCDEGWVCEAHPSKPWPHGDCAGPGQPCENPNCPHGQRVLARKPIDEAIDRERYPELFDAKGRRRAASLKS
jgi:hypothetical protein